MWFECVRNSAEEETEGRKASATKEKEAGKTLDFTAIGSRKCDYRVVRGWVESCAPERAYARSVGVQKCPVTCAGTRKVDRVELPARRHNDRLAHGPARACRCVRVPKATYVRRIARRTLALVPYIFFHFFSCPVAWIRF